MHRSFSVATIRKCVCVYVNEHVVYAVFSQSPAQHKKKANKINGVLELCVSRGDFRAVKPSHMFVY